jgi:hypothetical protein
MLFLTDYVYVRVESREAGMMVQHLFITGSCSFNSIIQYCIGPSVAASSDGPMQWHRAFALPCSVSFREKCFGGTIILLTVVEERTSPLQSR